MPIASKLSPQSTLQQEVWPWVPLNGSRLQGDRSGPGATQHRCPRPLRTSASRTGTSNPPRRCSLQLKSLSGVVSNNRAVTAIAPSTYTPEAPVRGRAAVDLGSEGCTEKAPQFRWPDEEDGEGEGEGEGEDDTRIRSPAKEGVRKRADGQAHDNALHPCSLEKCEATNPNTHAGNRARSEARNRTTRTSIPPHPHLSLAKEGNNTKLPTETSRQRGIVYGRYPSIHRARERTPTHSDIGIAPLSECLLLVALDFPGTHYTARHRNVRAAAEEEQIAPQAN